MDSESDINHLQVLETAAFTSYRSQAEMLSQVRKKAGKELSLQVTAAMQTIAMAGGEFSVSLMPLETGNANGLEQIEFRVAAHLGLPLRPLTKVASGGSCHASVWQFR
ncbi:hypothetical protein [Nitrosomonas ureae]|uniref:hypothetical protein n=1 Tax=Nitrosomonas ureae TaxID=44577 RepID=UPI000ACB8FC8